MARILIVDDERLVRVMVKDAVERLGHEVSEAGSLAEGMTLAVDADLVLLDALLPDGDGLRKVEAFAALPRKPEVVVLTGFGHAEGAAVALGAGALDYLAKPLRRHDLERVILNALSWREQRLNRAKNFHCPEIVGESRCLKDALDQLAEVAASDVSVLLMGETGTGKELFARALHHNSRRSAGPSITVDCAALPPTLLEAQLFGHAKGAFTGADRSREGLLRAADRGTLFLDEVGELPLDIQGVFLRALDVRRFRPVGEKHEVESDFRLVAATNRDLDELVRTRQFRGDLLFRLQGMVVLIPPLRRRREDIPLLVRHFLEQDAALQASPCKRVEVEVLRALVDYDWPGNIRELEHVMRSACAAAGDDESVRMHHLPHALRIELSRRYFSLHDVWHTSGHNGGHGVGPNIGPDIGRTLSRLAPKAAAFGDNHAENPSARPLPQSLNISSELPPLKTYRNAADSAYLDALLDRCHGDMPCAAKRAGVSRGHLYELLRRHGKTAR